MGDRLQMLKDMGINLYGLGENVASLGSAAIAEPVAGFAAMYDPQNGAQAIREGMTYQPRGESAKMYQKGVGDFVSKLVKPVIPVIDTWKQGVDIAGRYSPAAGAALATAPTALAALLGYKPAMQTGRQVSNGLDMLQRRVVANANAPRTLNAAGFRGQRGVFAGINALTADKEALAKAQQMIAQGVDPEDVWQETGWGRGADGKWRFEIDDSKAILRDYQFTPKEAYEQARTNAFISDNELMMNRAKSMSEYASMTKNQLIDEYKRTGNEIVDAAINGDIEKAKLLSEKRSGLDALLSQMGSREYGKTSSFIAHGDLGRAYPDVYKIHTRVSPDDVGNANAHYYRGNDLQSEQIVLGRKPILNSDKSTMLHELQHAIQQREGFARGGNPEQFRGVYKDPYEAYRKLGGEVEARMVQNRMDLTPQQRRNAYPFAIGRYGYEDIPKNEQIITFGNNKAMSQRPLTEFEQAHLTAQRNAALPVNQGGLGLAPDNTAMDRARAMGWVDDGYHGTSSDFPEFSLGGYGVHGNVGGTGVYLGVPDMASSYAQSASSLTGKPANVMPLLTRGKLLDTSSEAPLNNNLIDKYINENLYDGDKARIALDAGGKRTTRTFENIEDAKDFFWNQKKNWEAFGGFDRTLPKADMIDGKPVVSYVDFNAPVSLNGLPTKEVHEALRRAGGGTMTDILKNIGYDGTKSARETVIFDPKNIRSRFAAFDPFNRDSSNLLAQSAKLAPSAGITAYLYGQQNKDKQ